MRPPYRLVPERISTDTVQTLEILLDEARRGRLIGFAFAGMYRERRYLVDVTGECSRNPTFTRGMLAALDDRMGQAVGSK